MSPVAYVALFGAGVASFANPCIAPLVPVYFGIMAPPAAAAADRPRANHRPVTQAIAFVVGFSAIFVALGALAAATGAQLATWQATVERAGGVIVIGLGLIQLGILSRRLGGTYRLKVPLPRAPLVRPFVVGLTFGTAWTPCVGPLLAASLVVAARAASIAQGIGLLSVYALGVGLPFVAASLVVESTTGLARRLRSRAVQRASGIALVAFGALLLAGRYGTVSSALARLFPA